MFLAGFLDMLASDLQAPEGTQADEQRCGQEPGEEPSEMKKRDDVFSRLQTDKSGKTPSIHRTQCIRDFFADTTFRAS